MEKVEVPKWIELQTSRSQKGTKSRGPKSGCRAATALHRVGETYAPPGGTGWVAPSGDSVAKEWRNRVLHSLSPFALPSVACPLSLPSRLFSLSLPRPSFLSLLCPITPKNPRACAHLDCVLTSGTHPSFRPFL